MAEIAKRCEMDLQGPGELGGRNNVKRRETDSQGVWRTWRKLRNVARCICPAAESMGGLVGRRGPGCFIERELKTRSGVRDGTSN